MLREVSAGGVIYRERGTGVEVCLILRRSGKRRIWGLPKGHVEAGERLPDTAIREIREETGLLGRVVNKLGAIAYWFLTPEDPPAEGRVRHEKIVHFYLAKYVTGSTRSHDAEVDEARWWPVEPARKRLTYPNERKILDKAIKAVTRPRASV